MSIAGSPDWTVSSFGICYDRNGKFGIRLRRETGDVVKTAVLRTGYKFFRMDPCESGTPYARRQKFIEDNKPTDVEIHNIDSVQHGKEFHVTYYTPFRG